MIGSYKGHPEALMKNNRTIFTVLGMLAVKNFSGYEIAKRIKTTINYFWSESEGQIYPALAQCVKEGLAVCKVQPPKDNHRTKKIYSITAKGKRELIAWLKQAAKPELVRNELLLKLFFGANIDKNDNMQHIIRRQREIKLVLADYDQIKKNISVKYKGSKNLKYWLMTLNYGIKSAEAELVWCNQALKMLKRKTYTKKKE